MSRPRREPRLTWEDRFGLAMVALMVTAPFLAEFVAPTLGRLIGG